MKKNVVNQGYGCSFDECNRPARYKLLCNGHYAQSRQGKELTPLKPGHRKYGRVCRFRGCRLQQYAKGYCNGHCWQMRNGKELTPLENRNAWEDGKKVCPGCGDEKTEDMYSVNSREASGFGIRCKRCLKLERCGVNP